MQAAVHADRSVPVQSQHLQLRGAQSEQNLVMYCVVVCGRKERLQCWLEDSKRSVCVAVWGAVLPAWTRQPQPMPIFLVALHYPTYKPPTNHLSQSVCTTSFFHHQQRKEAVTHQWCMGNVEHKQPRHRQKFRRIQVAC